VKSYGINQIDIILMETLLKPSKKTFNTMIQSFIFSIFKRMENKKNNGIY